MKVLSLFNYFLRGPVPCVWKILTDCYFHWRFWICYGVTPSQFLAVNQTRSEEEVATLVRTLLNASLENMIWNYSYVPMNANTKDMNTCMVKRYWTNLLPSYGLCYSIVQYMPKMPGVFSDLKLTAEINNFRDKYFFNIITKQFRSLFEILWSRTI